MATPARTREGQGPLLRGGGIGHRSNPSTGGDAAGEGGVASPRTGHLRGVKRGRKLSSSISMPLVGPDNGEEMHQQPSNFRKRQMSPRSKSKLERLVRQRKSRREQSKSQTQKYRSNLGGTSARDGGDDGKTREAMEASVSSKPSSKNMAKSLDDSRGTYLSQSSPPRLNCRGSKETSTNPLDSNIEQRPTPTIHNSDGLHDPDNSVSPLDYRPQSIEDGLSESDSAVNPILESYARRWTTSTREESDREASDDPSSSVVSERSDVDDEEGKGVRSCNNVVNESNSHGRGEVNAENSIGPSGHRKRERRRSGSDDPVAPPTSRSPQQSHRLELEYGRLAFLKQGLERKMMTHRLEADAINPWTSCRDPVLDPVFGVGPIAACGIDEWDRIGAGGLSLKVSACAEHGPDFGPISRPSQEDVAFGQMAYKRVMAERQLRSMRDGRIMASAIDNPRYCIDEGGPGEAAVHELMELSNIVPPTHVVTLKTEKLQLEHPGSN
ncbi:hypothetical protein ACHAWF_016990 [Thalassiosira exigua]